jgi:hypothetical protein
MRNAELGATMVATGTPGGFVPRRRATPVIGWITVLFAVLLVGAPVGANPPPWERTEERAPCADFNTLRSPYFGETHVHTGFSADAVIGGIVAGPRDAYQFALGQPLGLPPFDAMGNPTRTTQLRRPLDFTLVSDHAEHFGEIRVCMDPMFAGYTTFECQTFRDGIGTATPGPIPVLATIIFYAPYTAVPNPVRFDLCGLDGEDCAGQASLVWLETRAAAEEFYDRSPACTFTSFVGYEWTGTTRRAPRRVCGTPCRVSASTGSRAATSSPFRTIRTSAVGSCSRRRMPTERR